MNNFSRGHGFEKVMGYNYMCAWVTVESKSKMYDLRMWPGGRVQRLVNMREVPFDQKDKVWKGPFVLRLEEAFRKVRNDLREFCDSGGTDREAWERLSKRLGSFSETRQ